MNIKKLNPNAIIPTRGSEQAAGWDLYASNVPNTWGCNGEDNWTINIEPGATVKIGTGIAIELPNTTFGGIYPRSGLATKQGLAPANKVGVIDSDYRGEVIVALHNHSCERQQISYGDRIAQLIVQPYLSVDLKVVDELGSTKRGDSGFGSTGK